MEGTKSNSLVKSGEKGRKGIKKARGGEWRMGFRAIGSLNRKSGGEEREEDKGGGKDSVNKKEKFIKL